MPDNDPVSNSPHLKSRLAVGAGSHPPRIGQDETSAAFIIEQLILDGDPGPVRRFLHEAEHHLSPWQPDPWALLEHLTARQISRQHEQPATPYSYPCRSRRRNPRDPGNTRQRPGNARVPPDVQETPGSQRTSTGHQGATGHDHAR